MSIDLSNYVDCKTRVMEFVERFPNGSIICDKPHIVEIEGKTFIEVTALVECNDGSGRTARASAWEIFPGQSNFTRNSEQQNGETSAVSRALGFLGIGIAGAGIASLEEVRNRREESKQLHPSSQPADDEPRRGPGRTVNKYAKTCGKCGQMVGVGEGVAIQSDAGTWRTFHNDGQCPE